MVSAILFQKKTTIYGIINCECTNACIEDPFAQHEVNVRTGMAGWHKRINKNYKSVARTAQLNDQVTLDPSRDAVGIMHTAAKKAILRRPGQDKVAREIGALESILTLSNPGAALRDHSEPPSLGNGVASTTEPGHTH